MLFVVIKRRANIMVQLLVTGAKVFSEGLSDVLTFTSADSTVVVKSIKVKFQKLYIQLYKFLQSILPSFIIFAMTPKFA